jgi:hypothetical protein
MLSLLDVFHLLADEFPSLSARGSPFAGLFFRALDNLLLWHHVPLSFVFLVLSLLQRSESG